MSEFNGILATDYLGTRQGVPIFCTTREVVFRHGAGRAVVVPVGTETDLASVPRWLQWLCPRLGPWDQAAVVHDYLCQKMGCSRFIADAIFREAMAALGVPLWRRVSMYYAVRLYAVLMRIK